MVDYSQLQIPWYYLQSHLGVFQDMDENKKHRII